MINRIVELELQNFRIFSGTNRIPLDANVVLIYGPNGTGKTNLLSGLECAFTGEVADLKEYTSD